MKKFILLLHEDVQVLEKMSPQEMQNLVQAHMSWTESLAEKGHLIAGDGLEPDGKHIHGTESDVKDGPYMESKEMIGGFYLLQGDNLDQIIEIAKSCPCHLHGGITEVRAIMDY